MNTDKNNKSVSQASAFLRYAINCVMRVQHRKNFNLFWNKLTVLDRKRVILLIGIDNKPVPSLTHLKAELFLVKNCYSEKWIYGGIE
jgi:hypothetical protein